jgi:hypothetical protein
MPKMIVKTAKIHNDEYFLNTIGAKRRAGQRMLVPPRTRLRNPA